MTTFNKPRPLDYILPGLLLAMLPLDIIIGLVRGSYPTQATFLTLLSVLIGLYLVYSLRQLPARPSLDILDEPETTVANARLNRVFGASLLIFGVFFHLFWLLSILTVKPRPIASDGGPAQFVEAGIVVLFTLLIAVLQYAGSRVYYTGRKG